MSYVGGCSTRRRPQQDRRCCVGSARCLSGSTGGGGRWTLLCLSSRLIELDFGRSWQCGGLDEAIEASGEDALQAAADVAVGLALGGTSGFIFAGFRVA